MSTIDQISATGPVREALAAHAGRLKHDLGKYVAMQQRWLGPDPSPADLLDALRSDLRSTRRGPAGTIDAVAVWAEFRPVFFGEAELMPGTAVDLSGDPDVQRIDDGMRAIEAQMAALDGEPGGAVLDQLASAALDVSEGCRALARRLGDWVRRADG